MAISAVDTLQRNQHGRLVTGRHLFVCTNGRAAGKPACGPRGGDALIAAVQRELLVRKAEEVLVTPCGCLGPCFDGPNAVVYPDGVWYAGLEVGDAGQLTEHLIGGSPLVARVSNRPGDLQEDPVPSSVGEPRPPA
jgi:(2Fe-2S) ferredoxin